MSAASSNIAVAEECVFISPSDQAFAKSDRHVYFYVGIHFYAESRVYTRTHSVTHCERQAQINSLVDNRPVYLS